MEDSKKFTDCNVRAPTKQPRLTCIHKSTEYRCIFYSMDKLETGQTEVSMDKPVETLDHKLEKCLPGDVFKTAVEHFRSIPDSLKVHIQDVESEIKTILSWPSLIIHSFDSSSGFFFEGMCCASVCVFSITTFNCSILEISGDRIELYLDITHCDGTRENIFKNIQQSMAKSGRFEVLRGNKPKFMCCNHKSTKLVCVLYLMEDAMAVRYNSIRKHLLSYNKNIEDLAILLKMWMLGHKLIRRSRMPSSTLLWLLIFYLQQLKKPLVPPIIFFQTNMEPILIGSANFAFNFSLKPQLFNECDAEGLFLGFFEFYDKFDFENQLISPLYGRTFPRENFEAQFPNYFQRYRQILNDCPTEKPLKLDGPQMCIQDPFKLCLSLPRCLISRDFMAFKAIIGHAANACRSMRTEGGDTKDFFRSLFNFNSLKSLITKEKLSEPEEMEIDAIALENIENEIADDKRINCDKSCRTLLREEAKQRHEDRIEYENVENEAADQIAEDAIDESLLKTMPITNSFKFFIDQCEKQLAKVCVPGYRHYQNFDQRVKEMCCQLCIDGVIQILHRLCGCKVRINDQATIDSKYSKRYVVTGLYDVFEHRLHSQSPHFVLEVKKAEQAASQQNTFPKPLKLICHIWANTNNFEIISVDFVDLCDCKDNSSFEYFFASLGQIFRPLVTAYLEAIKRKQIEPFAGLAILKEPKSTANLTVTVTEANIPNIPIHPRLLFGKKRRKVSIWPLEDDMKIVQELLFIENPKRPLEIDSREMKESWAELCMNNTIFILEDLCGFKIEADFVKYDPFGRTYNAVITHNVFHLRKHIKQLHSNSSIAHKIVNDVITNVGTKFEAPIHAKVHLWANDLTSVTIYFECSNPKDEQALQYITVLLRTRMQDFITGHFLKDIKECGTGTGTVRS